jgi:hypothetical protein
MEAQMAIPQRRDFDRNRKARLARDLEDTRATEALLADLPDLDGIPQPTARNVRADALDHDLSRLQQSHDELRELLLTLIEDRALCRDRSDIVDRARSAWLRSALV